MESLFDFSQAPALAGRVTSADFGAGSPDPRHNFFKGAKWSPDGTCLLTCSEDTVLRLFELPQAISSLASADRSGASPRAPSQLPVALQCKEGECVYDYAWYPLMSSANPATCCFVSSCRDHPVHMWDAFTGALRATYRAYDQMDEIAAAFSLAFNLDGTKLFCGFNNCVRIFSIERAGRDFETVPTVARRKDRHGQRGIISSIAFSPDRSGLYAAGSYARTVGLYDERQRQPLLVLAGHAGGVTQVAFSPDGRLLYTGARRDGQLLCWDVRATGAVLARLARPCGSNQRLAFDVDAAGRYLVTGAQDGRVLVYPACPDAEQPEPLLAFPAHASCTNGASLHPFLPLLATASGERTLEPAPRDAGDAPGPPQARPPPATPRRPPQAGRQRAAPAPAAHEVPASTAPRPPARLETASAAVQGAAAGAQAGAAAGPGGVEEGPADSGPGVAQDPHAKRARPDG
eukprot:tig00020927_g15998.t1